MAHEIFGDRFIARSQPAWHNIARRIYPEAETITAQAAMAEVAGDIEVVACPVSFELDGQVHRDEDRISIVRRPTSEDGLPRVLGVTSDKWVAASYPQLAGALDELARTHRVETAGVLKKGGLAFLCFRDADWSVKGDEMRSYFAASFSLTPGIGHRVMHSPVRVVCWNTLTMAEREAGINLAIPHAADALQRIELASRLAARFKETKARAAQIFEAFADRLITKAEAETIFAAAFPNPAMPAKVRLLQQHMNSTEAEVFKGALSPGMLTQLELAEKTWERDCLSAAVLRDAAHQQYEEFEPARLRGTAWSAFNAATEVSDWRKGRNADESAIYGSRAAEKSRAFQSCMEIVGVRS